MQRDTKVSGTEERPEVDNYKVNWYLTKLQRQYNEEGIVLLTNGVGANYTPPCKIMYLNTNIALYIKINSKWEI